MLPAGCMKKFPKKNIIFCYSKKVKFTNIIIEYDPLFPKF